jgi:uncharacterized protein involved in response to NO
VSAWIGAPAAALVDLAFPAALTGVFAREVIAAGNYRNLRVVALVALLGLANAGFHLEAAYAGLADYSVRGGIGLVLVLIMLVGGRIIPAFTRNWLTARGATALPVPFGRYDAATVATSAAALLAWTALPWAEASAVLLILAGAMNLVRLARWQGLQTRSEPLMWILHLAYATVPLGFAMVGASILAPGLVDPMGAVHVWAIGTFGTMTLAVMTRASRGHSGQPLAAGRLEVAIYGLVLLGALARVAAPYLPGGIGRGLEFAGLAWALAFLGFALGYGRMLLLPPARRG